MLKDIVSAEPLTGYRLKLAFEDGAEGTVAVRQLIEFTGVFEPLRDEAYFKQIRVNAELGTIEWPNGADLDPDVLYASVTNTVIEQEHLLTVFCRGVQYPEVSGFEILELLNVRSALAPWEGKLSDHARKRLEKADAAFLGQTSQFYASIAQVASLAAMRKRASVSPSHWWWYLDTEIRCPQGVIAAAWSQPHIGSDAPGLHHV